MATFNLPLPGIDEDWGGDTDDVTRRRGQSMYRQDDQAGMRRALANLSPWDMASTTPTNSGKAIGGDTPNNVSASEMEQNAKRAMPQGTQDGSSGKTFNPSAPTLLRPGEQQEGPPSSGQPRTFNLPSSQFPDVSGQISKNQAQIDALNKPMTGKQKIFNLLAMAAPVALGGIFGGYRGAAGAAGGVTDYENTQNANKQKTFQLLTGENDRLQGIQERSAQAQQEDEYKREALGLMKRPEVQQTPTGPIQYDPQTKTWSSVMVDGKPVGARIPPQKFNSPQEGYSAAVADAISRNADPATDPKVMQWKAAALGLQKSDKPDTATEIDQRYDTLRAKQISGQKLAPDETAFLTTYRERKTMAPAAGATIRVEGATSLDASKRVNAQFDTSRDADARLSRMESAYQKALGGDQQAMLALLTDHIGMTLGLQKGARITKDILNEAQQSQPWLEKLGSKFDDRGYLSGATLGPEQMKQMLDLGYEARNRQWNEAFDAADMYGVQPPAGAKKVFGRRDQNYRVFGQPTQLKSGATPNPNMATPSQPGAGTVLMKAPNGQTKPVPADQVEHYKSLGAVPVSQ